MRGSWQAAGQQISRGADLRQPDIASHNCPAAGTDRGSRDGVGCRSQLTKHGMVVGPKKPAWVGRVERRMGPFLPSGTPSPAYRRGQMATFDEPQERQRITEFDGL